MVVIMIISGKVFSMSKIRHELFREGIWVTAPFVLAPKINCEHVLLSEELGFPWAFSISYPLSTMALPAFLSSSLWKG